MGLYISTYNWYNLGLNCDDGVARFRIACLGEALPSTAMEAMVHTW